MFELIKLTPCFILQYLFKEMFFHATQGRYICFKRGKDSFYRVRKGLYSTRKMVTVRRTEEQEEDLNHVFEGFLKYLLGVLLEFFPFEEDEWE